MSKSKLKSKEYLKNIEIINHHVSRQKTKDKQYNLLVTVKDGIIIYKIFEIDKIWLKEFEFEECQELKDKMGSDVSWEDYFNSLNSAINQKRGGDLSIKLDKKRLIMSLDHPLSDDLIIKSEIVFTTCYDYKSYLFMEYNNEFINDLYDSIGIVKEKEIREYYVGRPIAVPDNVRVKKIASKLYIGKPVKRRYNAKPIKQRKGIAPKFTGDNDIEECEGMLNKKLKRNNRF
jgi:hypothetical protein